MTAKEFRRMALSFPETVELAHMGHPDFRVGGRIFATHWYPDESWGMVKLTPQQQATFVRSEPTVFTPVKGAWGRRGATSVRLRAGSQQTLQPALRAAWSNTAPKRVTAQLEKRQRSGSQDRLASVEGKNQPR
jgi:hypothetical protein